jgi:hypothetical protein
MLFGPILGERLSVFSSLLFTRYFFNLFSLLCSVSLPLHFIELMDFLDVNLLDCVCEDLHQNESSGDTQKRVKSANRERPREVPMYDNLSCVKLPPALATYDPIPISRTKRNDQNRQSDAKKGRRISSAPGQREKLSLPGYQGGYIGGLAGKVLLAGRVGIITERRSWI